MEYQEKRTFKNITIGVVLGIFLALVFFRSADAQEPEVCHTVDRMVDFFEGLDQKDAEFIGYLWDGSPQPGVSVVYVVSNKREDVEFYRFKDGCLEPQLVMGADLRMHLVSGKFVPMNETVEINISNSAVIFDTRANLEDS